MGAACLLGRIQPENVRTEQARAIKRVLDMRSREVVGWLYRWDTGHLAVMWKGEMRENVIYE